MQIESDLYSKQGKSLTNFAKTLPKYTSDLAQSLFKSEYNLEFLGLNNEIHERHIERKLIEHIKNFLLELGTGFAFIGNQYKVTVGGDDFFLDLLFYHVRLRCYIVIELKTGKFEPSFLGQLEFYLTVVDTDIKQASDEPTIGLLLCRDANRLVVEYALKAKNKPIGISKYVLSKNHILKDLESALPTPEQFEHLVLSIEEEGN